MKRNPFFRIGAASVLIFLGGVCAVLALANARPGGLSLEQRVDYQRRIEEVYWRHRIATTKIDQPLAFAEAMPESALRAKVDDTLRKSAALATHWQRPITAAQLQAEISRMAAQTRQPGLLRELWAALDHDPEVIAECLARPLLVERQINAWYARDARFHGQLRARLEGELKAKAGRSIDELSGSLWERQFVKGSAESTKSALGEDGAEKQATKIPEAKWQGMVKQMSDLFAQRGPAPHPFAERTAPNDATSAAPLASGQVSALQENDHEFFVIALREQSADRFTVATKSWPKQSFDHWWQEVRNELPASVSTPDAITFRLPQVAEATAADDTWLPTTAPLTERQGHSAVWTGSEMIVWGGFSNPSNFTDYFVTVGSRYNPATDTWHFTKVANAPTWRERHTAIWTGTEMIIWGGNGGTTGTVATGARYNPATDTWTPTSTTGAPMRRTRHVAAWTGSRMIVWGGRSGDFDSTTINTGGIYDPVSNSWTAMTNTNAPAPRVYFTGVWSGSELIVWGGYSGPAGTTVDSGGRYNLQTNTWQATSTPPLAKRLGHHAVWTGTRMLVWGGASDFFVFQRYNDGALYDPVANSWTSISQVNAPSPRDTGAAVWTGSEMLIWGGFNGADRVRNGGRYNPQTDTWQSLSTTNAPQGAILMSAVWTGQEMIVWGGQEPTLASDVNTGARYNPVSDSWVPMTNPQNGGPRLEHPAVWTGAEMIVWGSYGEHSSPTNTGARYYPSTDLWLPTSLVNAPERRYAPLAVWTGQEMIAWGGCRDGFCGTPRLNSGGRYNPATNSWQATSLVNAAQPRYWFSAVWSGTEMIVWGGCDAQTCGPGGSSDRFGLKTGGRYNPQTDSWQATNLTGAPDSRWLHTAVWTGNEMIVWGGIWGLGIYDTGGRYNPQTDSWMPTSTVNAPTARHLSPAAWTGSRMFVWGGYNSLLDQDFNTGGLYDPVTDSWTATSLTSAPSRRASHTVVWTGEEMIVWGGTTGPNHQNATDTGGRYHPLTDTWRATSRIEAPSSRNSHSAVFTGNEMIVFGGESCARCEPVLDTGGRYAVAGAPVATAAVSRQRHGSAGFFDLVLPLTGTPAIEARSGGRTADFELLVTFNSDVSVNGNPQAEVTSGDAEIGQRGTSNGGAVTVTGNLVMIPLTNVANAQTIEVTLFGVDNNSSSIDFSLHVSFLLGDTTGNGAVDALDLRQTRDHSGEVTDASNFNFDVSTNGVIDNPDLRLVRENRGSTLP